MDIGVCWPAGLQASMQAVFGSCFSGALPRYGDAGGVAYMVADGAAREVMGIGRAKIKVRQLTFECMTCAHAVVMVSYCSPCVPCTAALACCAQTAAQQSSGVATGHPSAVTYAHTCTSTDSTGAYIMSNHDRHLAGTSHTLREHIHKQARAAIMSRYSTAQLVARIVLWSVTHRRSHICTRTDSNAVYRTL